MAEKDEFSRQLLEEILEFLEEGGDDEAAFVIRTCRFTAGENERVIDFDPGVWVFLGCSRLVYDMLTTQKQPLLDQIEYAVIALRGELSTVRVNYERMLLSEESEDRIELIAAMYATPSLAAATNTSDTAKTVTPIGEIIPTLCFVIMSFSESAQLKEAYMQAVKPTVEQLGFSCERTDEQQFNGSIPDQITLNIRRARFIIADLTEARPNCYYELGYAHALGKPVIHIAADTSDIHFDVKTLNFIVYASAADLRKRLRERIEGTMGVATHS